MSAFSSRLLLVAGLALSAAAVPALAQSTSTTGAPGATTKVPAGACNKGQNSAAMGATGTNGATAGSGNSGTSNQVASQNGGSAGAKTGAGMNPANCM